MTTTIELGLGAVRECDLDLTIGELNRLGKFIQQCMEDEREACAAVVKECAENASKKKNLPCRGEVVGALMYAISAIRARECEGRPD
jgi:hypothetical protein